MSKVNIKIPSESYSKQNILLMNEVYANFLEETIVLVYCLKIQRLIVW